MTKANYFTIGLGSPPTAIVSALIAMRRRVSYVVQTGRGRTARWLTICILTQDIHLVAADFVRI